MQEYRIFLIGSDRRIVGPAEIIECPNDEAAVAEAQQYLDGLAVEVWKGARMIAHFDPIHSEPS
jgi:hypothetical protein